MLCHQLLQFMERVEVVDAAGIIWDDLRVEVILAIIVEGEQDVVVTKADIRVGDKQQHQRQQQEQQQPLFFFF